MQLTKDHVLDFLSTEILMAVATSGDHPWIATVYYGFDDDLTLYFISGPKTLHSRQIANNEKVAVSIANSSQKPSDKKRGFQMFGIATKLDSVEEIEKAIKLWKKNTKVIDPKLTAKSVKSRMYKIVPKKIKHFNQELFEVEDGQEPILEL